MSDAIPLDPDIVRAAQALLGEIGPGFTVTELEARTGLSRSTLYRRIGSKRRLLERLANERCGAPTSLPEARILRAAREVVTEVGLTAATMEQIADRAGVGVATVYRRFGDKEGLLSAFVEAIDARLELREAVRQRSGDLRGDLRRIVAAALRFATRNRDLLRLVLFGGEAELRYLDELRRNSDSGLAALTDYLAAERRAGRLRRDADPVQLALALMGTVLALTVVGPLRYGTTPAEPETTAERVVALFLDGIAEASP